MKCIFKIILILLILANSLFAQNKARYPIWTTLYNDTDIYGISLSLNNNEVKNNIIYGLNIEILGAGLIMPLAPRQMFSMNDSEFANITSYPFDLNIDGISFSPLGTCSRMCNLNGIGLNGFCSHFRIINGINLNLLIFSTAEVVNGVSGSLMFTGCYNLNGLEVSLFNGVDNISKGVQIGGINMTKRILNGVQIGALNLTNEFYGVQIGIYNKAKIIHGLQIGFLNDNSKFILPFINW